ncbi:FAD dependent oxidoreductase [Aspergillus sclerotialis]|uniref:FAD dependent oxidoreductase n=1 Tax=Aspergillus sclerotialis TaxID=2070753 RepID=A0A3A2Z6Q6_9EURO|nr:FAD dependent oxidoreductase [Aspergillus sclerotialis]
MQEQVTYFKPRDPECYCPRNFPVWIWGGDTWYYDFPTYCEPIIKVGQDAQRNVMHPDHRTFVHSPELLKKLAGFMDSIIPDHGPHLHIFTCQHTITPDRRSIIGPLKKHPDIIIALGNGHAFNSLLQSGEWSWSSQLTEKRVKISRNSRADPNGF